MPPLLPMRSLPRAHFLPPRSNPFFHFQLQEGRDANKQGLHLEVNCMTEPSFNSQRKLLMVFSPFEVGEVSQRRGKGFCEASKPLIGSPFPTVRNTNTTLYLSERIPPSSLLAVGVVPAAGWGNSNAEEYFRGGLGQGSGHP